MPGTSAIAAVTRALRNRLASALGAEVEVTTLSPARAHAPAGSNGAARVNLALVHLAFPTHLRSSLPAPHAGRPGVGTPGAPPLELVFLVTAQGAPGPDADVAGWALLESALGELLAQPALELTGGTVPAVSLTLAEAGPDALAGLWRALRSEFRPSLLVVVGPVDAG
jgi:hypothetical protein